MTVKFDRRRLRGAVPSTAPQGLQEKEFYDVDTFHIGECGLPPGGCITLP